MHGADKSSEGEVIVQACGNQATFSGSTEPDLGPKQCTGLYSEMTFWLHLCMTETGKLLFQLDFSFFWKHGHSYTSHF